MRNLNCAVAAQATGASHGALPDVELTAVTTDSREVVPGSLFGAIPGERVDGHNYIAQAYEKGAVCALCQHPVDCAIPQLIVPDTQRALEKLAAFYRAQFDIPMVGVTGSVGKTTAKEMIAAVLSQRLQTLKTCKNNNNELGVSLTLLRLRAHHQVAVVEMGISHFGEMTRQTRMVRPTIAVFTLIGDAHLEFLQNREGVLRAKAEIMEEMATQGVVICNGDDPLLRNYVFDRRTIRFGFGADCDVRAGRVINAGLSGIECEIVAGDKSMTVSIPAFGRHMVYAALTGAAVGLECGLTEDEIVRGVAAYQPVDGRSVTVKMRSITLIDDCYNSNPTSAKASIDSLLELSGRKVCILGDMLELGEEGPALHRELGAYAASRGAVVIACGPLSKSIADGAGRSAVWYESTPALMEALPRLIREGDTVLIKASRNMRFEKICDALKKDWVS